jgi:hypothetical protein
MKRVTLITSAATLLLAVTALASPTPAQSGASDVTFEIRVQSGPPGRTTSSTERFAYSGMRARMEVGSDSLLRATGGMYMIVNVADSTVISVMPTLRSAMIMRVPRNAGSALGDEGKMSVSDVTKSQIEDLGPGERLLGRDTHHYRITRAATLTTTFSDRTCSIKKDQTEDVWIATDPAASAAIRAAERQLGALFGATRSSGESWSDVFDRAAPNRPPRGLELRSITRNNGSGADAKPDSSVYAREYTALSQAPVDTSIFAMPAGFTVQDMRGMQGVDAGVGNKMRGAGLDSALGCRNQ